MKPLRIAMLAHSTHARGGVVHALELSEALQAIGHDVTLHAPDASGRGFFRSTRCRSVGVRAAPVAGGVYQLVQQRVAEYLAHFDRCGTDAFDVWHAQDSISANALATLVEQGRIAGFVRTVHHLDRFDDARVMALQQRGHRAAAMLLCVSRQWCDVLARDHATAAVQVANGVDTQRYSAAPQPHDAMLAARLGLRGGPVLLAVGGIEARKNTLATLQAFIELRADQASARPVLRQQPDSTEAPQAQLVIAGGASLLDHDAYRAGFDAAVRASGLRVARGESPQDPAADIIVTGPLADADMPSLYRAADALLFPSLKEGFGLVVLEALACGTPVVVSRIAPFTEHLHDGVVAWCDPLDPSSVAQAARRALDPAAAAAMVAAAAPLLQRYSWAASAARHADLYRSFVSRGAALPAPSTPQPEPLHA